MPFCWRKLRHPVSACSSRVDRKLSALLRQPVRRQKMNFVIGLEALRVPMLGGRMVAREWLLKPGTDIFRQAGREFVR